MSATTPAAASRRPLRLRSLLRILAAVVAVAFVALAAVGTVRELNRAGAVQDYSDTLDHVAEPSFALIAELQAERRLTASYWTRGRDGSARLDDQRSRTDRASLAFSEVSGELPDGSAQQPVARVLRSLNGIEAVRGRVAPRSGGREAALGYYTRAIDRTIALQLELRPDDGDLAYEAGPLAGLLRAQEALALEDTLLAGARSGSGAADGRRLPDAERTRFAEAVGAQRYAFGTQAAPLLPAREKYAYEEVTLSSAWAAKTFIEDAVLESATLPDAVSGWREAYDQLHPELVGLSTARVEDLTAHAGSKADDQRAGAYWLAAGAALLTLAVLLVVAAVTRSVVHRAEEVRSSALAVARRQLPQLIVRLQRGEDVDLSVLPAQTAATDEFGEISNVVARLAEEVVDAARLVHEERYGFEKFAEGVTLRAVTLIFAVLRMLDDLQHRYADTDPELLAELYELDHLTVRVRRQLENLLVLSGGAVANPHTEPVHVANLIVDAAGESRGFAQVTKEFRAEAWVLPEVAGELTHLIAELIENATTYSPSGYEVFVRATDAASGVAIEVEDKGRAPEHWYFEALNSRLLDVPPYAVLARSSNQLGLFVVGQLAQRHGVKVSLQEGRFGGVLAVVLVPHTVLTRAPGPPGEERTPLRARNVAARKTGPRPAEQRETTPAGLARRQPTRPDVPVSAVAEPAGAGAEPAVLEAEPVAADAEPPVVTADSSVPDTGPSVPDVEAAVPDAGPARPAAGRPSGLPQRVPGSNLVEQLRADQRRPGAVMDERSLDNIESSFTQLQQALTDPEEDSE